MGDETRKLKRLCRAGRAGDQRAEEAGGQEARPGLDLFDTRLEVEANESAAFGDFHADGISEELSDMANKYKDVSDQAIRITRITRAKKILEVTLDDRGDSSS